MEKKSTQVRKQIENHTFDNEEGEEYQASNFGGFTDYFRRKKIKLQNLDVELRARSGDKPQIFRGIVVHINGYTQPSLNDLHAMLVSHGAGFVQYLDGKTMVTHIIASSLTLKKAVEFKKYRMVKPAWIVDSVEAGRLLPWQNYRVVDEGVGQKVLAFDKGEMVSQVNKQAKGYKEQSDSSWYTTQIKKTAFTSDQDPSDASSGQVLSAEMSDMDDLDNKQVEKDSSAHDSEPSNAGYTTESRIATQSSVVDEPGHSQPQPQAIPHREESKTLDLVAEKVVSDQVQSAGPNHVEHAGIHELDSTLNVRPSSPKAPEDMTAEEHNAVLLADPRLRKSTVVNPDFLEQYYRESRLHHLSTWKADLKSRLQSLTAEKSASQKKKERRKPGSRRYIMHVDFDSFFAAVSLKKFPQYKDKPAVVAHGPGSGSEIASCNYPAREYGISNGMWMKRALELYADLNVLPYDFPAYEDASRKFYDVILETNGVVQSVSIDEALVDISEQCISASGSDGVHMTEGSNYREQAKADEIASNLRDKVFDLTGCNVSVGIGGNILQAKLALRKAKPAGQYQLKPDEVLGFIGGLEVQKLPGVAYSIAGKLEEIGVKYVKDIRETTKEKLVRTLGPKTGEKIYEYARGIDKAEVGDQVVRKSVSAEVNWGVRFENQEQVDEFIQSLCGELQKRLMKENVKGCQLTVKVMRRSPDAPLDPPKHLGHGKCDTYNKSLQLGVATNNVDIIAKEALATMRGFGFTPGELRGIGIQMTKLEPIKAGSEVRPEGSQPRLRFKAGEPPLKPKSHNTEDPITDDIVTPKKQRVRDINQPAVPFNLLGSKSPSRRPLNTMGTQFFLPSQIDSKVLAELPEDLRSRLMQQMRPKKTADPDQPQVVGAATQSSSQAASRHQSPAHSSPNKLDKSFLDSLPEDIRSEIQAMYPVSPRKPGEQSLLPQSPRKNRTIPSVKKPFTRKRGGALLGRKSRGDLSTLTQANFVSRARMPSPDAFEDGVTDTDGEAGIPEVDDAFLASLPESMRQEVLDQHRANQLRRSGGIEVSAQSRARFKQKQKGQQQGENTIESYFLPPPQRPKPKFMKKYSEVQDLREVIQNWVKEFANESPYNEDVDALLSYLTAVVLEEKDMSKAVKIAKWLIWVVDREVRDSTTVHEAWSEAVLQVNGAVQAAVKKRGLGPIDFE